MVAQWTPLGKAAQDYFEKMLIEDIELHINKSRASLMLEVAIEFRLTVTEYARLLQGLPI